MDNHTLPSEDFEEKGALSSVCSQAVLKCLYMTRLARPELYWAVNSLAREVIKWTVACDKRLHRLISHIHHNTEAVIKSWIGNNQVNANSCYFATQVLQATSVIANQRLEPYYVWLVLTPFAQFHGCAKNKVLSHIVQQKQKLLLLMQGYDLKACQQWVYGT